MNETKIQPIEEAGYDKRLDDRVSYPTATVQEAVSPLSAVYRALCVVLLLLSYFLSQYDKCVSDQNIAE